MKIVSRAAFMLSVKYTVIVLMMKVHVALGIYLLNNPSIHLTTLTKSENSTNTETFGLDFQAIQILSQ